MKRLFVFTIATNVYNSYLQELTKSWHNAFPNVEEKWLIPISDRKYEEPANSDIKPCLIPNLQYNLICVSKFRLCEFALDSLNFDYSDDDIFLYVDADTKFIERPMEVWQELTNQLACYDLVVNPYLTFGDRNGYNPEIMLNDYCESNKEAAAYFEFDDNSVVICTNMIGGKISGLHRLAKDIYDLLTKDLNISFHERHFPVIAEETYVTYIYNMYLKGLNSYNIKLTYLHAIPYVKGQFYYLFLKEVEDQIKHYPSIIAITKYNNKVKKKIQPKRK